MQTAFYYQADADLFAYLRQRANLQWLERNYLLLVLTGGGRIEIRPRQRNGYRGMWNYQYLACRCEAYDTGRIYVNVGNMAELIVERKEDLLPQIKSVMLFVQQPGFIQQPLDHGQRMPERERDSPHHRRTEYHQIAWDLYQLECQRRLTERQA